MAKNTGNTIRGKNKCKKTISCCSQHACMSSTGSSVVRVWLFRHYNNIPRYTCVCMQSAAAAVAMLLLLVLLLLFVIVHLPPEVVLHTTQTPAIALNVIFFVANENTLVHPLAVHSLLCRLGLPDCILCLPWALQAYAEPQAGVSPPRRSLPCLYICTRGGWVMCSCTILER